ncbi:MAG: hypothetical protein AAGA66_07725 [Bacteroidota bacterium]
MKIQNIRLRKLAGKQVTISVVLSILINWASVYYSFEGPGTLLLFGGEYSIARFLLPMSFILPFLISFDLLQKSVKLASSIYEKEDAFPKKKYLLKSALINAIFTFTPILSVLFSLYLILPDGLGFQRADFALFIGLFSGLLAMFFAYRSIHQIDKLMI